MHQHSAPGLQVRLAPQREQMISICPLSHGQVPMSEDECPMPQLWCRATLGIMPANGFRPFEVTRGNKGTLTMKNPLDSLGQTITLGVALTVVVILLIHAIA